MLWHSKKLNETVLLNTQNTYYCHKVKHIFYMILIFEVRISCLERMYPVNLMMKMCQVVIRQCEGYTQHKSEVVDYYESFRDFLLQILKVYAPKRKF